MKHLFNIIAALLLVAQLSTPVWADVSLPYSGRFVQSDGSPVDGPVDIVIEFFSKETGDSSTAGPYTFQGVALQEGVFQINLVLTSSEAHHIFPSAESKVWIQVTDSTNGSVYPRQMFAATPLALKVPVDGSTVSYDDDGRLQVISGGSGNLVKLDSGNKLPASDGSKLTNVNAASVGSKSATEVAASVDEVTASSTTGANDALVKTDGSGQITSQGLILPDSDTNKLVLKAHSDLTSDHTYTFPPAPISGNFLSTDAGGNLSWSTVGGGGDMLQATYDKDADNIVDAAAFIGNASPAATTVNDEGGDLGAAEVSLTVADATSLPSQGFLLVEDEVIGYGAVAGNDITALTRGVLGTTASIHTNGVDVRLVSMVDVIAGKPKVALGTGELLLNEGGGIRFVDDDSSHTAVFKAPTDLTADVTYTLPAADGSANQVLKTNGSGVLAWGSFDDESQTFTNKTFDVDATGNSLTNVADGSIKAGANINATKLGTGAVDNTELNKLDGITGTLAVTSDFLNNMTQNDGQYLATDEVRARDGDGLKLYDDGGNGIFIEDGGEIGIGTTSPANIFHVEKSYSNNTLVHLNNSGGAGNAHVLKLSSTSTGSSTDIINAQNGAFVVKADGDVGIGVNPATDVELHIKGKSTQDATIELEGQKPGAVATGSIDFSNNDGAYYTGARIESINVGGTAKGALAFLTNSDGSVGGTTNLTEAMRVDENGNVAIGTTIPTNKLEISGGSLEVDGQSAGGGQIYLGSNELAIVGQSQRQNYGDLLLGYNLRGEPGSDAYKTHTTHASAGYGGIDIGFQGVTKFYGYNGATSADATVTPLERMRIASDGNVGIGTKSPGSKLEIVGTGNDTTSGGIAILNGTDGNSAGAKINFSSGTADVATGFVGAFSPAYTSSTLYQDRMVIGAGGDSTGLTLAGIGASQDLRLVTNNSERVRVDSAGNVGIGTTAPKAGNILHLHSNVPRLAIQDDDDPNSLLQLKSYDATSSAITHVANTGDAVLHLQAEPLDGSGQSLVRFFRTTSTTGFKALQFFKGDNTSTVHAQIGVDGDNTYFSGGGNVGIGSTNPSRKLDVAGDIGISDIYSTQAQFDIVNSSGNGLSIAGSGKVGIGTTAPLNILEAQGSAIAGGVFTGTTPGVMAVVGDLYTTDDVVALDFRPNDLGSDAMARVALEMENSGSKLLFGTSNDYSLGITNTAMTIDSTGNVGFGVEPNTAIDLNGAVSMRGMAAPAVSPAGQGRIYYDSTANKIKVSENGSAYKNLGATSAAKFFGASIASGCSISYERGGDWLSGSSSSGTGLCNLTLQTSPAPFASAPACTCTSGTTGSFDVKCGFVNPSDTTQLEIKLEYSGGVAIDHAFEIICVGE